MMETESRVISARVDASTPTDPPPSHTTRLVIQFSSLVLGAVSILLCAVSLHHDFVWNSWVDIRFNLNRRNPMFRQEVLDYLDLSSQQEWINLVSKEISIDQAILGMTVIVVILMSAFILTCSYTKPFSNFGGVLYMVCAGLTLLSGFTLIASIIVSETKEAIVSEYIGKALNNRLITKQPVLFVKKLEAEVVCPSEQPSMVQPLQQCQLLAAKLFVSVFFLINTITSLYLSFSYFHAKERCCHGRGDRLLNSGPSAVVVVKLHGGEESGGEKKHHHHHHHHHHRHEATDRMNDRDKVFHPSVYEAMVDGNHPLTDESHALIRKHRKASSDSILRQIFYTDQNESVMTLAPAYWDERVLADELRDEDPNFISMLEKSMSGINASANATRVYHDTIGSNHNKAQHPHPYKPHYHG